MYNWEECNTSISIGFITTNNTITFKVYEFSKKKFKLNIGG